MNLIKVIPRSYKRLKYKQKLSHQIYLAIRIPLGLFPQYISFQIKHMTKILKEDRRVGGLADTTTRLPPGSKVPAGTVHCVSSVRKEPWR